jgi:acyl-coenzyme A synthetase/AMP-(fatty) acid ligase
LNGASTLREAMVQEGATFLELIAAHARGRGAAIVLCARGRPPLSYAALHALALRTGASLAECGIGRGRRVALALPEGGELAAALLATMCWVANAPLRRDLDDDAATDLLTRLRIDALIVPAEPDIALTVAARRLQVPIIRLVPEAEAPCGSFSLRAETPRAAVAVEPLGSDDIASLSLTSGTTGKPKIVAHTPRKFLTVASHTLYTPEDRALCVGALSLSGPRMTSVYFPLRAGASIVCLSHFAAADLPGLIDEFAPTTFWTNPATLASAIDLLAGRRTASLRYLRSSSAALTPGLQARAEDALGIPILQGYGMTETLLIAINPRPPGHRRAASVGIAHSGEIVVRDHDGQPAPPGVPGEVTVRGPGLAAGYEGEARASRIAFDGEWFRTGDLGHLDDEGYLFLTGRKSELINRGGMKVAPSEVDEVLMRHPQVRVAVTFPVPHASLGEDVATAVVLHDHGSTSGPLLRDFGAQHLPPHKVPSSVVVVDDLPLRTDGKVQRAELAARLGDALRTPFVAPGDRHEALIASVYAEVLGIAQVGSGDNFFALGGDSLRGAQVLTRITALTGIALDVMSLFRAPIVGELARLLDAAERTPASAASTALPPLLRSASRSQREGDESTR